MDVTALGGYEVVMRSGLCRKFAVAAAAFIALLTFFERAGAHDYTVGSLQIVHPWTRATPTGAKVAAGYMTIHNRGTVSDRLVGGSSTVAGRFEVHQMTTEQNVMVMRPIGELEIKPGETIELKPESLHVMLVELRQPLAKGERVKGTLVFEKAGTVEIEYVVQAMGAPGSEHGTHPAH
jgi:copper(I)-binding protein